MNNLRNIEGLKSTNFDLVIIGAGATGSAIALDASYRNLKCALIDVGDFSTETSSRSTKLLHGGVRYLEQAVKKLDMGQLQLVKEALKERKILMTIAPHLTRLIHFVTPVYSIADMAYYFSGLKAYDWMSGNSTLGSSGMMSAAEVKAHFPLIKTEKLRGGVSYVDGQFDDARLNLAVVQSAAAAGAVVANYVGVTGFGKTNGKISSVKAKDSFTGELFDIRGNVVINATGSAVDIIRKLDEPHAAASLDTSVGSHIILPKEFASGAHGLLIPNTSDGRVIFLIPWRNVCLAGTTDFEHAHEANPKPSQKEIEYLLKHVGEVCIQKITATDILSSWAGIRPLVVGTGEESTAQLSREHAIFISSSGLVSVAGGKWTTFRKIAEDCLEYLRKKVSMNFSEESVTATRPIWGGDQIDKAETFAKIDGVSEQAKEVLYSNYGSKMNEVARYIKEYKNEYLNQEFQIFLGEVQYSIENEGSYTVADFLARRRRLAFMDSTATESILEKTVQQFAISKKWNVDESQEELKAAKKYFAKFWGT